MENQELQERLDKKETEIENVYNCKNALERRYQWVLGILVVIMSYGTGYMVKSEMVTKQIAINTIRIDTLEKKYDKIDNKLETIQNILNER
jgi:peptidoglycan hydrolase CwlO-like protein